MDNFKPLYKKLNQEQKLAVDTIEGPVMVIAGAGTGKTQVIAVRIANILFNTQTPPSSILCLTFTDNAAFNMRQRLLSIIGPDAYKIRIHTFHSFCNEVIKSNPDYFIISQNLEAIDELEKIEIVNLLIDQLPDASPLKPWGDHYYYQREIISSIQTLKRENVSPDTFEKLVDDQQYFVDQSRSVITQLKNLRASKKTLTDIFKLVESLIKIKNLSVHIYHQINYEISQNQNDTTGSNLKKEIIKIFDNLTKNIPKQFQILEIFKGYQNEFNKRGLYDFDDMILLTLHALKNNPDLLMNYQEKYQYLLVDEYQDSNSSQNQILELLTGYQENPNLFVVGDDDQAIFRFQGASIENIFNFYQKYHPKIIVLKNNYRSHQIILDSANSVINKNQNRISTYIKNIDKSLKSVSTFDPNPINLITTTNNLGENYFVANKVKELLNSGTEASEIAILYRNNSDIYDLAEILTNLQINFYLSQSQNILKSPPIIQLIYLLQYIDNPHNDENLYHILASPFINLNVLDLLKITRFSYIQNRILSELIFDPKLLSQIKPSLSKNTLVKLKNFNIRLAKSRFWLENYNLNNFFNKIIRKFKFLPYLLKSNDINLLNELNTFYSELKHLSLEKKYTLKDFLKRLAQYQQNSISLPAPPLLNNNLSKSIQLMTVHKAKGLEFEHVFLIKVVDKKWGNNSNISSLRLPIGILKTEISRELADENEDERRLFYVALTRAKSQIYISYSGKNDNNREQLPSIFVSEIKPELIETSRPDNLEEVSLKSVFSTPTKISYPNQLNLYLRNYLATDYKFNITHLNAYLRCPFCFYYQTILRIPAAKNKASSFGTAIHIVLSKMYTGEKDPKNLRQIFKEALIKENLIHNDFRESLSKGEEIISGYLEQYQHSLNNKDYLVDQDFKSENIHFDKIPLTGKIDLIEKYDHDHVNVVDFKTGNPDTKYKELSPDGDYFRQLVFYKFLISQSFNYQQYKFDKGIVDFVQKSKSKNTFIRKEFDISAEDVSNLKKLIKEVYEKILNLDFYHLGKDCQDNLKVHYLLKNNLYNQL